MHVSVTTLGADAGSVGRAADHIVGYLEGGQSTPSKQVSDLPSRAGSQGPDVSPVADGLTLGSGPGGYYADSAEQPGRWCGEGTGPESYELGDRVASEQFRRVLLGQDPHSGEQLVSAQGSAGRANGRDRDPNHVAVQSSGDPDEMMTPRQVAKLAEVDQSHIRRLIRRTVEVRAAQAAAEVAGEIAPELPAQYLDAEKDETGRWQMSRAEVERFTGGRKPAQVVLGYDITWSVPKSVSALYAQGDERIQEQIDEAVEESVAAGMTYLETEGFHVRAGRDRERAGDMVAASYRHHTNRSLEPQLHEHVVIANMATNSAGAVRAVDARGLYAHATPAGYLATAELRHQLSARLGVQWAEAYKGLADIAGVDRSEIMAVSSRRQDVLSLSEELGFSSPQARQTAALATRPGKEHSVEAEELRTRWKDMLSAAGLTEAKIARLTDHGPAPLWRPVDTKTLFSHLGSHRGVTEQHAIFDRRDVIMAIAEQAGNRLSANEILDLADQWLTTEAVVPLDISDGARRETIGYGQAQVSIAPDEARFTTPQMIAIDQRVTRLHQQGIDTGHAVVRPLMTEQAINHTRNGRIQFGADQAGMIRSITTSGDQFQAVVGMAGAGKTTALRAAVAAWKHAGFEVLGAAPFAEAARNLESETGLRSQTLEGLLTRIELAGDPRQVLKPNTVVIVDEASTIGNRQLNRLYRAAAETGATVRTIGDPQQHQSVEAGGLWRHLTEKHPERTPVLGENRRQTGEDMNEVRAALAEYRQGLIGPAMNRLENDNRIVTADSWKGLLDAMTADWYLDHRRHLEEGVLPSKMIAERNSDRHALNARAQQWLQDDGTLGQGTQIGNARFHVGDRVVAQTKDRDLRADGANRRDHVINGSQGTVVAFKGSRRTPDLIVDFDGLGRIRVPNEFAAAEVGPGRGGGLSPAYAVTSFKAEGQTYDAGRNLAAPGTVNTEGMYVALTRGRNDQRTYTIAPADRIDEVPELPIITDERAAIEVLIGDLTKAKGADLATIADPDSPAIAALSARPLAELNANGRYDHRRAHAVTANRIASADLTNPDPVTIAALGPRPTTDQHRRLWDTAVGEAAIYRARWDVPEITITGGVPTPTAGRPPEQFEHHEQVAAAIRRADQQGLETEPLQRLLTRRDQIQAALNAAPLQDDIGPIAEAANAARQLQDSRTRHQRATTRLATLQPLGRNRPRTDPDKIENARRRVTDTSQQVAQAKHELNAAKGRLAAVQGDRDAHVEVSAQAGSIDRAIDRRIDTAVRRPAPYLNHTLGPRPHQPGPERTRWNDTAASIDTYRHRHLGLSPNDGPPPGKTPEVAIGPAPARGTQRSAWLNVQNLITPQSPTTEQLRRDPERPARRIT